MADAATGPARVHAVRGAVIDASFPAGGLPAIGEALYIGDNDQPLIAEVQSHLRTGAVRALRCRRPRGCAVACSCIRRECRSPPPWLTPSSAG